MQIYTKERSKRCRILICGPENLVNYCNYDLPYVLTYINILLYDTLILGVLFGGVPSIFYTINNTTHLQNTDTE